MPQCFFSGYSPLTYPGRYSHAAATAFGDTLLVVGGYRGNMLGDVIAFKVPTSIATNKVSKKQSAFMIMIPQDNCLIRNPSFAKMTIFYVKQIEY